MAHYCENRKNHGKNTTKTRHQITGMQKRQNQKSKSNNKVTHWLAY